MTERQWRSVAELIPATETGFDQEFIEQLATAVRELDLPASVLQRMQQAATVALRRAFLDESTRAACLTVLSASNPRRGGADRSQLGVLPGRGAVQTTERRIRLRCLCIQMAAERSRAI